MYDKKRVTLLVLVIVVILGVIGVFKKDAITSLFHKDSKAQTATATKQGNSGGKDSSSSYTTADVSGQAPDELQFYKDWKAGNMTAADNDLKAVLPNHETAKDINFLIDVANFYSQETNGPDKTIGFLEQENQKVPNQPDILMTLAYYYDQKTDNLSNTNALTYASQGISIAQNNGTQIPTFYWDTFAWAEAMTGGLEAAQNTLINNIFQNKQYNYDDPSAMIHFALILEKEGQYDYAKKVCNDILNLNAKNMPDVVGWKVPWAQQNAKDALKRMASEGH